MRIISNIILSNILYNYIGKLLISNKINEIVTDFSGHNYITLALNKIEKNFKSNIYLLNYFEHPYEDKVILNHLSKKKIPYFFYLILKLLKKHNKKIFILNKKYFQSRFSFTQIIFLYITRIDSGISYKRISYTFFKFCSICITRTFNKFLYCNI